MKIISDEAEMLLSITIFLYVAGALNMAVMVSDHPNWHSWRTVALCLGWPVATVGSVIESATHGRVRFW